MDLQHAVSALVHDRVGQSLRNLLSTGAIDQLFNFDVQGGDSLLGQLTGPKDGPPRISIGLALDILGTPFSTLLDALPSADDGPFKFLKGGALTAQVNKIKDALTGHLQLLDGQRDIIARLVAAQDPERLREVADDLFARARSAFEDPGQTDALKSVKNLQVLVGKDVGVALPFATLITAVQGTVRNAGEIPPSIEQGLIRYFFDPKGFVTVDGESVIAPVHLSDVKKAVEADAQTAFDQKDFSARQLRGLFSKTNAERYLRDIIRILVESTYDAARGLRRPKDDDGEKDDGRYAAVVDALRRAPAKKPADAVEEQFVAWFRGFSSMAESATMRGVEIGTQGVSEFQTNPLIAASAGSFAGTVSRKVAQDAFLSKLSRDLNKG